jgi:hypothetical protein
MPEENITDEEKKEIIKSALKEWLDEQFATFGKWTLTGLSAAALAGFVYLALISAGLHRG